MPTQNFGLTAADGYRLAATHYQPDSAANDTNGAPQFIVIGSATAVPRGFYRRFAEFAAARGIHVVTTDYRGIGDSKYAPLRGFEMEYADWSRLDLAAAVAWATAHGRAWLVGHSLAAHAIGQLPKPNDLQAAYICGGGAGWHGWMPYPERIKVWLMWNVLGPIATRIYGYQPMSKFGMGEDLPLDVYRDWRRWCQFPHYFFDDAAAKAITDRFNDVRIPIAAAVATDDLWAPPASRDAFFKGYVNAKVERIDLNPRDFNVPNIGHMGYYRASVGERLWPQILRWLEANGLRLPEAMNRDNG
jgi:predicted alpha/beta hydrolase